jgi:zinc protease
MTELHWTEVNGVATIWTEAPGPLRAGLLFRTGRVDETMVTSGYTHLIEHLVLSDISDNAQTSNGSVCGTNTGFFTMGRPDDVCAFLLNVCKSLKSLPADRLEAEKKILLTEAASKHNNVVQNLLVWRFGAAGYGLIGLAELGTRCATIEQLAEWKDQRFTSGNAVLWLTGPLPAGLRLDLPPGVKQPLPGLTSIQEAFPCWFVDNQCGGIAAGAIVPRVSESTIFKLIASKRLQEQLRTKQAVSYAPSVSYEPLTGEFAHLVLYADSDPDRRPELAKAFGEIIEKLAEIDEGEVDAVRKQYLDHVIGPLAPPLPDQMVYLLQRAALDWLLGRAYEPIDQLIAEISLVSADTVAAFGRDMQRNTMLAVPGKVALGRWMGQRAPISNGQIVKGRYVLMVDAPIRSERLIYGTDGVSILFGNGSHMTVRYSKLVAAVRYEDGCLRLVGSDATWLTLEPTLWRNGPSICREICGRIPAHLFLEHGTRSKEAIPKPETSAWQRFRSSLSQRR